MYARRVDTMGETERSALRRDRFGFVFQFGQLVPELTAEENRRTSHCRCCSAACAGARPSGRRAPGPSGSASAGCSGGGPESCPAGRPSVSR
jgi:putative ABC transport system ATP-binding protein